MQKHEEGHAQWRDLLHKGICLGKQAFYIVLRVWDHEVTTDEDLDVLVTQLENLVMNSVS